MPANRQILFARLTALGIAHQTQEHKAVFTVEESLDIKKTMHGGHSKNLFLKDKANTLSLVVALADTQIDLKALGKTLRAKQRLSFGKPALMAEVLGVSPGSVTPFALINDPNQQISHVIIDQGFFNYKILWFHPLENNASTALSPADLITFVKACGHSPLLLDPANPPAPSAH